MRRILAMPLLVAAIMAIIGTGTASAHVPFCAESVNPHGQNVPPAGSTTLPGPNGGQNEDGFYKIGTDVGTSVSVVTGGVTFGPFPSGSVITLVSSRVLFSTPRPSWRRDGLTPALAAVTRLTGSRPRSRNRVW